MKGYHSFPIAMGRAVARNMLQISDLRELDEELYSLSDRMLSIAKTKENEIIDSINQLWDEIFVKESTNFSKFKKTFLIISRTNIITDNIPSNSSLALKTLSKIVNVTDEEIKKLKEAKKDDEEKNEQNQQKKKEKESISFRTLARFFKGERRVKILFFYLFQSLLKEKKVIQCYNCDKKGKSFSLSYLTLSNNSNYIFDFQRYFLCFRCLIYTILSNLYPLPNKTAIKINNGFYYSIISDDETDLNSTLMFYENQFDRFLKYVYLNDNFSRVYLLFFKEGEQSGNMMLLSISQFNIVPKLISMLENGKSSATDFKKIFLNQHLLENLMETSTYVVSLSDFIQTTYLNKGLLISFINMFRNNFTKGDKRFYSSFVLGRFSRFVEEYLEVNEMEKSQLSEESKTEENPKLKAFRIGRSFGYRLIDSEDYLKDKDRSEKYLVSSSAVMELSGKEFIRIIIELTRQYGLGVSTKINEDIQKIADDEELRLYFILGMLSSISRNTRNAEPITSVELEEVKEDIN